MDYKLYQERVLGRASHRWHNERIPLSMLAIILREFIKWGNELDAVKKSLMYDRPFMGELAGLASVDAETMPRPSEQNQRLIHAMLGVATEGVEMMEAVQEFFFGTGEPGFDLINLQEEFGDIEWYRALGLDALGQTDEQNREQNDAKLEKRYGSTFSEAKANNVDPAQERRVLEGRDD